MLQVLFSQTCAPRIAHGDPHAFGKVAEGQVGHRDSSLNGFVLGTQDKLHVHRVTMADRNGGLQPFEPDLPGPPERIRPTTELAKVLHTPILPCNLRPCNGLNPYQPELKIGRRIAESAGAVALDYKSKGIGFESKSDESPVTVADRECEKLIVAELQKAFPGDGLLGEEGALKESTNGRKWIIDPIDGTRDFIRGTRAWSVLIGLEQDGEVVAGFAYFPAHLEMYFAAKGAGAWWIPSPEAEAQRLQISAISKLSEALVCFNGLSYAHDYPFAKHLTDWLSKTWTVRSMGGCLDAMLVSSGRADVWVETRAKPWDLAPLKIIAEEAGAVTFDFAGENTIYGGNFAITVPALAEEVKRFLAS
jgi:histidinol-phosphatase